MTAQPAPTIRGFWGKIPARGDFVGLGLPGDFVRAWDGWMQAVLPAARAILGDAWLPAWMEAPVWHFALAPGACGPWAALGVWMPSVDRVGRHFPLVLAEIFPEAAAAPGAAAHAGLLAAAEAAGRDALAHDLTPEALAARIAGAPPEDALPHSLLLTTVDEAAPGAAPVGVAMAEVSQAVLDGVGQRGEGAAAARDFEVKQDAAAAVPGGPAAGGSLWWTEGSPRVLPGWRGFTGLPRGPDFARMVDAGSPAGRSEAGAMAGP